RRDVLLQRLFKQLCEGDELHDHGDLHSRHGMVPQRKYMATMHSVVPQRRFMGAGGSVLLQRRDVGSRLTATNDKLPLPDTGGGSLIPTQGGFFHEGLFH